MMSDQFGTSTENDMNKVILQDASSLVSMSTLKRKHSNREGNVKSVKLPNDEIIAKSGPIEITDLHVDCFENIFKYLSLNDLLNVVHLSEHAQMAAKLVFARRYSQSFITFFGWSTASFCTKVLQTFGDDIKQLKLAYFREDTLINEWTVVIHLINKKCTSNLRMLELRHIKCEMMELIENVFDNVECLSIGYSRLGKFVDLTVWFPNLRRLHLYSNDRCIQTLSGLSSLNYLAMSECLSTARFKTLIESASKLETLWLYGAMKLEKLKFVSDILTGLKHLHLCDFFLEEESDDVIMFDNVQTLSISKGWDGELPLKVPFKLKSLTNLRVITNDSLGEPWINFAMEQRNLTKLLLDSMDIFEINYSHLIEIATTMNHLVELHIPFVATDCLDQFLSKSKSLQRLVIRFGLRRYINPEWTTRDIHAPWIYERKHK